MRPHIGALVVDEDGDVANDPNATIGAVGAQGTPLLKKCKLQEALLLQLCSMLLVQLRNGVRVATNDLRRPAIPGRVAEVFAKPVKQNLVFEPPMVLTEEPLVLRT